MWFPYPDHPRTHNRMTILTSVTLSGAQSYPVSLLAAYDTIYGSGIKLGARIFYRFKDFYYRISIRKIAFFPWTTA